MNIAFFLEIKNEYTEHLIDNVSPYIYEGILSIYREAVKIADENKEHKKLLLIFQKLLQSIDNWSQIRINNETDRIKQLSKSVDYMDDLLKAVIRSNIVLLTCNNMMSSESGQTFLETIQTPNFIHRAYIECGKYAHNNPYLFYHDPKSPMEHKRNLIIVQAKIKECINRAIRKILPISIILKEYLLNSLNIFNNRMDTNVELLKSNTDGRQVKENTHMKSNKYKLSGENKSVCKSSTGNKKLELEIEEMIRSGISENGKEKIKAIMKIDNLLTSQSSDKYNRPKSSVRKKESNINISSMINVYDDVTETSEKPNIEFFGDMPFISDFNTELNKSKKPQIKSESDLINYQQSSEKMPLSQVNFIEDYGHKIR